MFSKALAPTTLVSTLHRCRLAILAGTQGDLKTFAKEVRAGRVDVEPPLFIPLDKLPTALAKSPSFLLRHIGARD